MDSKTLSLTARITVGILILGLSLYFIINSLHLFTLQRDGLGKYFDVRWILHGHIGLGTFALLSGPFLLWKELRNRYVWLHRNMGKAYVFSILVSGLCAAYLSATTAFTVGWAYAFSLHVWVSLWLTAAIHAYIWARQKKFKLHKEWMIRSYILTFSFTLSATLLKIPFIQNIGPFAEVSPSFFWVSWALPLYVYELVLSYRRRQ